MGVQRVKGLSISRVIVHALKKILMKKKTISRKTTETSLIESFLYPKLGAGQMYEEIARKIIEMGGEIHLNHRVEGIKTNDKKIVAVKIADKKAGNSEIIRGNYFFSTMPIKEIIRCFDHGVPKEVREVAEGLVYRDYILVGVLLRSMKLKNNTRHKTINDIIPDNWIYVQEREVKMGRLDFINNFSLYMLKDHNLIWVGAEYFCNEGDLLWVKSDREMADFAIDELTSIDMITKDEVLDFTVVRMPKAYPAYFGTYDRFDTLKKFFSEYENLFLIGRNGMHKYNNMDHSILTAMAAVDNVIKGIKDKENIWEINAEEEYHEIK